jgi:hypothetical protein
MRVEVLAVADCPHRAAAIGRVHEAVRRSGRADVVVVSQEIEDADAARAAGMRGSPTILIDGRDPFPNDGAEPSLSCRLYCSMGAVEGAPSVAELVEALG